MITDSYKAELAQLHARSAFGFNDKVPQAVHDQVAAIQPNAILDFGCGSGSMVKAMRSRYAGITIYGFDPGVEEYSSMPPTCDLTYSIDCLEHIEPDQLDEVLDFLFIKTRKSMYLEICCSPAKKTLSDGRNAHLIQQPGSWWRQRLLRGSWTITHEQELVQDHVYKIGPWQTRHYLVLLSAS